MSSITTKQGDQGNTRLYSGERVSKSDLRMNICGDIDELVSILGIAYSFLNDNSLFSNNSKQGYIGTEITYIQKILFIIASEIATRQPKYDKLPNKITITDSNFITNLTAELEGRITLPKGFILPGANIISAHLDLARTITRRCERKIVTLKERGLLPNELIIVWLNRLSDYLYLLARASENNNYRMVK